MAVRQVSLAEIAGLMKEGYVRFRKEDDGNGLGSIEEKTGLTPASLKEIFGHRYLKGIRIKVPLYILIEDYTPEEGYVESDTIEVDEPAAETPSAEMIAPALLADAPFPVLIAIAPGVDDLMTDEEAVAALATIMHNAQVAEDAIFA